jgi:hypothetical protein
MVLQHQFVASTTVASGETEMTRRVITSDTFIAISRLDRPHRPRRFSDQHPHPRMHFVAIAISTAVAPTSLLPKWGRLARRAARARAKE